jgi:hypothetical protein
MNWGKKKQGKLWEPNWYDQGDGARAASLLDPSNRTTITGALGAATNPIEDLRWVRNYCAHRGRQAARGIEKRHGSRSVWRTPYAIVSAPRPAPDLTQLGEWVHRFHVVAAAATK